MMLITAALIMASSILGQQVNDDSKSIEPILYQRSNYVWPFS